MAAHPCKPPRHHHQPHLSLTLVLQNGGSALTQHPQPSPPHLSLTLVLQNGGPAVRLSLSFPPLHLSLTLVLQNGGIRLPAALEAATPASFADASATEWRNLLCAHLPVEHEQHLSLTLVLQNGGIGIKPTQLTPCVHRSPGALAGEVCLRGNVREFLPRVEVES